jgi:hypothetical protein
MIYAMRSETFRFASRNERFVLPVLVESGRTRSLLAEKVAQKSSQGLGIASAHKLVRGAARLEPRASDDMQQ